MIPLLQEPVAAAPAAFAAAAEFGRSPGSLTGGKVAERLQPTPSAFSFRCSAERSIPTNSAVREMLPEKRLIWAIR